MQSLVEMLPIPNFVPEVIPFRIHFVYELTLFFPAPFLEFLFLVNGLLYCGQILIINAICEIVFGSKAIGIKMLSML